MRDLDETIREVLGPDDSKLFDAFGEQSLPEMVADSFQGTTRWLVVLIFIALAIFAVLGVWSALKLLAVKEIAELIMWATVFGFCMVAVAMMKVWYWMELNKNTVTREIKRLELQVAQLASGLRRQSSD